jgi:thiol-disulfide isomerase/thioredoxin
MSPTTSRVLRRALIVIVSTAIILGIYATWTLRHNRTGGPRYEADRLANFVLYKKPEPIPNLVFVDPAGKQRTLEELRGKVLLVNFWATWCAPCREEMPALDRLQTKLGGPGFQVVPISLDRVGMDRVLGFLRQENITHLTPYLDAENKTLSAYALLGLPTSVLIDRDGREVGRLVGPAKWDSPQAITFLEKLIAPGGS